jgi:predicted porin
MNRKFLIAAAASTLGLVAAGAHAQSTVNIYGIVGAQFVRATGITSLNKLDTNSIAAPRLGFKGEEDLGGGLKAFFDLESAISTDTGGAGTPFWNRGSYVGLAGSFGKVSLGRQWTLDDDYLCGLYVCGGYAAFYNFAGFGNTSDLVNNAVKYALPSIGGINGGIMVAPGEGATGRYTGAVLTYSAGPLTVGGAYDAQRNLAGKTDDFYLLAGKLALGDGFVRLAYANAKSDASGLGKASTWDLGGGYQFTAAASLSLDFVALDRKSSPNDASFVRLVGEYKLSKRTSLNANLIQLKNKGASAVALAGATVAPGGSQTVVTFGIAQSF